jgi:predicted  nucleic acid-binding Zn-ribbon protein
MSQPMNLQPVQEYLDQINSTKLTGLATVVANQAVLIEEVQHKNLALQRDLRAAQARIAELEKQLANESH